MEQRQYLSFTLLLIFSITIILRTGYTSSIETSFGRYDNLRTRYKRNIAVQQTANIVYMFNSSLDQNKFPYLANAMLTIEKHTCVRFVPLLRVDLNFDHFVYITNRTNECCANNDGLKRLHSPDMPSIVNLGDTCFSDATVVLGEMLHVVHLHYKNIKSDVDKYRQNNTETNGKHGEAFYRRDDTSFCSPAETNRSYQIDDFIKKNFESKDNRSIDPSAEWTSLDGFKKVNHLYGCNETEYYPSTSNISVKLADFSTLPRNQSFDEHVEFLVFRDRYGRLVFVLFISILLFLFLSSLTFIYFTLRHYQYYPVNSSQFFDIY